jgi:hypothetical protein
MIRTVFVTAIFALVAGSASAQTIDANGRCHDAKGKMAKMDVCKPATPTADRCRDKTTKKFAKCGAPNTEPVPAKK